MSRRQGYVAERSPGHWLVRYAVAAHGERRRFAVTVKGSRKDAEKELRRLLHSVDDGSHVDPTRMTVRDWLATWLASIKAEVSPKTHERYGELVNHFLVPALGRHPVAKLAKIHIREMHSALAEGGRRDGKPGGLSPQTRRHIHRVLHAALASAVEDQVIARNPAAVTRKSRLPKIERREMTTLDPAQSRRLLAAVRRSHIYWPVLLALSTGMRRGEVLALRWRNVDLDRGALSVVESLEQTRAGLRFKPPKTDRSRAVTLPAFAIEELRRLKRSQAEALLYLGVRQSGRRSYAPAPTASRCNRRA